MVLSLWSVLSALLWSSIFVFLFSSLRRAVPIVKRSGPLPLLFLAVLIVLRLILPLDIPAFTNVLTVQGSFTTLTGWLTEPIRGISVSPLCLLAVIWIGGAVFFMAARTQSYLRFYRRVGQLLPDEEGDVLEIAEAAAELLRIPAPLVIRSRRFDVPQICGLQKPMILMPIYSYTEEEYRFIFLHELQHWKTHDLWIKLLAEAFCCIFWWNPAMKLWKSELDQALEMRCDRVVAQVMHADAETIKTYIHVLNNTYLYSVIRSADLSWNYAVANLCASERMLLQREAAILEHVTAKKKTVFVLLIMLLTAGIFVFSFAFEIQPHHQPDSFDLNLSHAATDDEDIEWLLSLASIDSGVEMDENTHTSFTPLTEDGSVYGKVGTLSGAYLVSGAGRYSLYIDGQKIFSPTPEQAADFIQGGISVVGDHDPIDPRTLYPVKELSNSITLWPASYRSAHSKTGDILKPQFRLCITGEFEHRYWNVTAGCWAGENWETLA